MSDGSIKLTVHKPDEAKAAQDQGQIPVTTSISAWSILCDHPANTTMTDPARPSEDPADLMGDNKHCLDKPTELPDMPEGTARGWDGRQEVRSSKVEVPRALREGVKGMGDIDDDSRGPGKLHEPFNDPPNTA